MLTLIKSSFIDYKLTILRNKKTSNSLFRQTMNETSYLIASEVLSDLVIPAYGILPPGFPGYQKDLKGLEYNLEIAREYLAKSKYSSNIFSISSISSLIFFARSCCFNIAN